MPTTIDYIEFVLDQLCFIRHIEFRSLRMFGEYCIYANDKPIAFVFDNQVYVKCLPEIEAIMAEYNAEHKQIFPKSKQWYILDIENRDLLEAVIPIIERNSKVPKKRARGNKSSRSKA